MISTDEPGASGFTWDKGLRQEFKLYAVCTRGRDKGKSFGYASWGQTITWGIQSPGVNPARAKIVRWVEGTTRSGTGNKTFGVSRVGLVPLPGGISW